MDLALLGGLTGAKNDFREKLPTATFYHTQTKTIQPFYITRHFRAFGGATHLSIDYEPVRCDSEQEAFEEAGKLNTPEVIAVIHRISDGKRNTWLTEAGWH